MSSWAQQPVVLVDGVVFDPVLHKRLFMVVAAHGGDEWEWDDGWDDGEFEHELFESPPWIVREILIHQEVAELPVRAYRDSIHVRLPERRPSDGEVRGWIVESFPRHTVFSCQENAKQFIDSLELRFWCDKLIEAVR